MTETMTHRAGGEVGARRAATSERAFEVFTRQIGSWWPLDQHALHPGEVREVVWEEHEGGEVYEISTDGERSHWATVLAWEPPTGFTIAWQVDPDGRWRTTEVEVRFTPEGDGTQRRCSSTALGAARAPARRRRGTATTTAG